MYVGFFCSVIDRRYPSCVSFLTSNDYVVCGPHIRQYEEQPPRRHVKRHPRSGSLTLSIIHDQSQAQTHSFPYASIFIYSYADSFTRRFPHIQIRRLPVPFALRHARRDVKPCAGALTGPFAIGLWRCLERCAYFGRYTCLFSGPRDHRNAASIAFGRPKGEPRGIYHGPVRA